LRRIRRFNKEKDAYRIEVNTRQHNQPVERTLGGKRAFGYQRQNQFFGMCAHLRHKRENGSTDQLRSSITHKSAMEMFSK
jgi:hypothetical protein